MATDVERQTSKLEWACLQIESLLKRISILENPTFWREEAARQAARTANDQTMPMTVETLRSIAEAVALGECKPWRIWKVSGKPRCEHRDTCSIKDRGDGVIMRCLACGAGRKEGVWQRGDEV